MSQVQFMAKTSRCLLLGVIEHRIKQLMFKNHFVDDQFVIDPCTKRKVSRSVRGSFKVKEKIIFEHKQNAYRSINNEIFKSVHRSIHKLIFRIIYIFFVFVDLGWRNYSYGYPIVFVNLDAF